MDWAKMAKQHYGKFSESSYPYQLWEVTTAIPLVSAPLTFFLLQPDSQRIIQNYISIYESGPRHLPGFHFAINIDIAMFSLYSGTPPGETVNALLPDTQGAGSPLIAHLCGDGAGLEWFVYVIERDSSLLYAYMSSRGPESIDGATPLPNSTLFYQGSSAEVVSVSVDLEQSLVSVVSSSGLALFYSFSCMSARQPPPLQYVGHADLVDSSKEVLQDAPLLPCVALPHFLSPPTVRLGSGEPIVPPSLCVISVGRPASAEDSRFLVMSSYTVNVSGGSLTVQPWATSHITAPVNPDDSSGSVSSARLRVLEGEEGFAETFVLLVVAMDSHVYLGSMFDLTPLLPIEWVDIGVGEKVDVSVSSPVGTVAHGELDSVVIVVSDFGYCFNSHKHNTRSSPTICSSSPEPSKHVLDYSVGFARDWLVTSSMITPCDSRIFHGSYEQGSNPSVALSATYREGSDGLIEFRAFEVHEALRDSVSPLVNGCGNPVHRNGVVVNSYPFASWMSNMKQYKEMVNERE